MNLRAYAFRYSGTTGDGQDISIVSISGSDEDTIESILINKSTLGRFYLHYASPPPNFTSSAYRASLTSLDSDTDAPAVIINRSTGWAYDHLGNRKPEADEEPESSSEYFSSDSSLSPRDISLGDLPEAPSSSQSGESGESGSGEEGSASSIDQETYEAIVQNAIDEQMSGITNGRNVLINIRIAGGAEGWTEDSTTGMYIRAIASDYITHSTVLVVTGINREAVRAHIYWRAEDGRIVFETTHRPSSAITINGYLFATEDPWAAKGVIEAWPAAGITSVRFKQSAQVSNWSTTLSARGTNGDTKTIATNVDLSNAKLLFATPEWTGNSHVIVPKVWVNSSLGNVLCYQLTNLSDTSVQITEVMLRLCYLGAISGLVKDSADDASFEPYITDIDIDLMTAD